MTALQFGTIGPKNLDMESDSAITSFRDVMGLWASREAMASDVDCGGSSTVRKWWQRNNIPSDWWVRVLATDTAKASNLTADLFARLAAKQVDEARA